MERADGTRRPRHVINVRNCQWPRSKPRPTDVGCRRLEGSLVTATSKDEQIDAVTFRIFGRAHPERQGWWFDPMVVQRLFEDGLQLTLQGQMRAGNFTARLELRAENLPDLEPMDAKVALETFVRTRLDTLGLLHGAAVDCEVVQLELPSGEVLVLSTAFGGLEVAAADEWFPKLSLAAELVAGVRLGLADFRQAIRAPADTALFAYRGIEGIRADVAAREGIDAEVRSWERMREITGLDRVTDIDPIKAHADMRRHGNDAIITSEQRAHALRVLQRGLLAYAEWCADEMPEVRDALDRVQTGQQPTGSGVGREVADS